MRAQFLIATTLAVAAGSAMAATYNIDSSHTYPSFEADHMGLSVWRGKFGKTSGTITMDRAARTGGLDIVIEAASVDFGMDRMNSRARSSDLFNVEKFPVITYKSRHFRFEGEQLVGVDGELTLLGVTKPVALTVDRFKCVQHPRLKREVCGANAVGEFKRTDFGMDYATPGSSPEVRLAIQIEAIKGE